MKYCLGILATAFILLLSFTPLSGGWIKKNGKAYNLNYTSKDKSSIKEYEPFIITGMKVATAFFDTAYKNKFNVYIHPDRRSLDSTWQVNWKMPQFKSECWMVASGVANRIDIISPKTWDTAACEHHYADKMETQRVITHELVHVFHGQLNTSPGFSDTENIDWFIEGLATYASGQYDSVKTLQVKELVDSRTYPKSIDMFWTGKARYALSGSLVMYIDKIYGRKKLISLLKFNKKDQLMQALETTESTLLAGWAKYMK